MENKTNNNPSVILTSFIQKSKHLQCFNNSPYLADVNQYYIYFIAQMKRFGSQPF